MTKLRECPFCGKTKALLVGPYFIRCAPFLGGCGVNGPLAGSNSLDEAREIWNTRPGERAAAEATRDLLAACKGLIQWMLNEDALRRLGFNPERAMKDYHFAKEVIAKVEGR